MLCGCASNAQKGAPRRPSAAENASGSASWADHMVFSQGTRPMRVAYSNKPIENEFDAKERIFINIYKNIVCVYIFNSQVIYINGCGFEESLICQQHRTNLCVRSVRWLSSQQSPD